MIILVGACIVCIGIGVAYTGAAIEMIKSIKDEYYPKKEKTEESKPEVVNAQETEKVETVVDSEVVNETTKEDTEEQK